jgi:MFS family permease
MFGAITFMPLYLQIAQGASPTVSGLLLIPMTIGILLSSTGSGRYMAKTGKYRILPILGMITLCIGMLLLARLQPDTSRTVFSLSLATVGFGMGFIFPVITTSVQNAVPREQMGTATAAGLMFRQIGGSLAVAVFGAIFATRLATSLGDNGPTGANGGLEIGPQMLASLPEAAKDMIGSAVVNALQPIYLLSAALAICGLLISFLLREVALADRRVPQGE